VLVCSNDEVAAHDLGLTASRPVNSFDNMTLAEAERTLIEKALLRFDGNVTKAAELLGLSRHALHRRMEKYDSSHAEQEHVDD
jgi:DNA-binding NtrC family response regulator